MRLLRVSQALGGDGSHGLGGNSAALLAVGGRGGNDLTIKDWLALEGVNEIVIILSSRVARRLHRVEIGGATADLRTLVSAMVEQAVDYGLESDYGFSPQ